MSEKEKEQTVILEWHGQKSRSIPISRLEQIFEITEFLSELDSLLKQV